MAVAMPLHEGLHNAFQLVSGECNDTNLLLLAMLPMNEIPVRPYAVKEPAGEAPFSCVSSRRPRILQNLQQSFREDLWDVDRGCVKDSMVSSILECLSESGQNCFPVPAPIVLLDESISCLCLPIERSTRACIHSIIERNPEEEFIVTAMDFAITLLKHTHPTRDVLFRFYNASSHRTIIDPGNPVLRVCTSIMTTETGKERLQSDFIDKQWPTPRNPPLPLPRTLESQYTDLLWTKQGGSRGTPVNGGTLAVSRRSFCRAEINEAEIMGYLYFYWPDNLPKKRKLNAKSSN